jgi:hypothetical protein
MDLRAQGYGSHNQYQRDAIYDVRSGIRQPKPNSRFFDSEAKAFPWSRLSTT